MRIAYEHDLNPEQLDVVQNGDGPCLVLAGAGSGKTRTIVYRVAHLLDAGVLPQQILLLTFTNKAANAMLGRVEMLLAKSGPSLHSLDTTRDLRSGQIPFHGIWGGTFHHIANRILRRYAPLLGYQSNFTILDEEDSEDLLKLSVKDAGVDTTAKRFPAPRVLKAVISMSRNAQRPIAEVLEERHPKFASLAPTIEDVARRYDERKRAANSMDFDDLLVNLLRLLAAATPSAAFANSRELANGVDAPFLDATVGTGHGDGEKKYISPPPTGRGSERGWGGLSHAGHQLSSQFRYILVDEYQDTNRIQAAIVGRLASIHKNLLVVGDDAQSIYSFRAADVDNILKFPDAFSGARTFRIETNYRSAPPILHVANAVIANNEQQFNKTLRPMRHHGERPKLVQANTVEDEARYVAKRILELRDGGVPLTDIAVLFRATHLTEFLEMELVKRDIPYDYRGGIRFFERAHIKDVLAFLKVLTNPQDEAAWLRVLRMQRGIGDVGALEIIQRIIAKHQASSTKHQTIFNTQASSINTESLQGDGGHSTLETGPATPHVPWMQDDSSFAPRLQGGWNDFLAMLKPILTPHGSPSKIQRSGASILTPDPASLLTTPDVLIRAIASGPYHDYLESEYPNWEERLEDIEQLAVFASKYEESSAFLADTSLQELFGAERVGSNASERERIVLSTIHQAKGLEWRAVFVIGLTESALPNRRALLEDGGVEEERRLLYVAITRAKDALTLSYALSGGIGSSYLHAPSPFISEIPPELLEPIGFSRTPQRAWHDNDRDEVIRVDRMGERIAHNPIVVWKSDTPVKPVTPRKGILRDVGEL
ncbi:MAG: ATP-dependent helicase [Candidatus Uhrbacteria bacterium]